MFGFKKIYINKRKVQDKKKKSKKKIKDLNVNKLFFHVTSNSFH